MYYFALLDNGEQSEISTSSLYTAELNSLRHKNNTLSRVIRRSLDLTSYTQQVTVNSFTNFMGKLRFIRQEDKNVTIKNNRHNNMKK